MKLATQAARTQQAIPYPHAPLTEAVIDVRIEPSAKVGLDDLARIQRGEEGAYPTRKTYTVVQGQISAGGQVGASASQTPTGYVFVSRDEKQILQARMDGFAFSRLEPYQQWETFRDEARRLWTKYRSIAEPERITRAAVRYINRLDLPLPFNDFREFLRLAPDVPPELPQGLSAFLSRLAIPLEDVGATLLLTETLVPPAEESLVSIVLDIDIFQEFASPLSEEDLWEFFEKLRTKKNQAFEACITDQMRRLFE